MQNVTQLLNYCATNPNAILRYSASDMILRMHSDGSYLSKTRARSRAGGHFFMGSTNYNDSKENNGAILTISQIIKNVMASAAEAECGALFINTKEAVVLRNTLEEMGHPQPATPVQVDNFTADGIMNSKIQQKRSKAMDMRFYWVQDRVRQGQFHIFWKPGPSNLADYFTKHHAPIHHKQMRPIYLHCPKHPGQASARVCYSKPPTNGACPPNGGTPEASTKATTASTSNPEVGMTRHRPMQRNHRLGQGRPFKPVAE
jgi:hypothetical protein